MKRGAVACRGMVFFLCAVVGSARAQYEGDYRNILEDVIAGMNAEISAYGAAVGDNDAASAKTHLNNAVNLMKLGVWWSQGRFGRHACGLRFGGSRRTLLSRSRADEIISRDFG